ncbi:hypothetical protein FACS1894204_09680 [Synergistales bacterium]|nr:hypothetical protein FACS1894204_09680 [Synergistales bacterium]
MASTFKSNDTAIADILKDIKNGTNQLPDFQRGWVWDDGKICELIASISNSYPIGAFMFLEYGGDTVRFKYRPFTGCGATNKPDILVLDGQQRLTSIHNAMFCKTPVSTQTAKKEKIERYYYLDIDKCLSSTTDRIEAVISVPTDRVIRENFAHDIKLDLSTPEKEFKENMFPLNIVYDPIAAIMWMNEYQKYHEYNPVILQQYARFTAEILVPIQTYKVPVISLSKGTPKEAVCQVFEKVNTGGVSLTVFELVTATFASDDFDLRRDWYGEDDDKNNHKPGRYEKMVEKNKLLSVVSDVDFLVAATLLSRYYAKRNGGDSAPAVSCKKQDVLNLSLWDYNKIADALTDGFIKAANFLVEQRIFSARDLPYTTQFIPFSVLFTILSHRAEDSAVRNKLSEWYWSGVFGEMYGAANETRYVNDVVGVLDWIDGKDEPGTVARANFQPIRLLSLQTRNSAAYKGIMALILKAKALDFISGKEMDFTVFSDEYIDIHHIFPRAYCESKKLSSTKWNSIVNKTPLSYRTNRIVGGNAPSVYLKKIEKDGHVTEANVNHFASTHLIDVDDFRNDRFDEYFLKRSKALLGLIGNAMGKPVTGLGGEDVIVSFGGALE